MDKIVIGLIGEKGSGKGTVAKHLIEKYQAEQFIVSDVLKKILSDLALPLVRDNYTKLAVTLKSNFWKTILMDALIENIKKSKSSFIIADGIRMEGDTEPFKKCFGKKFHLIYVTADIKLRYERSKLRQEKGEGMMTFEEYEQAENLATEIYIRELGKQADFTLTNNKAFEDLIKQVEKVMKKIIEN